VLRCFGPRDRWLANQEIAARTGLARPTVSRLVYTLTELGFLRHAHALRKYGLGSAAVSLGYSALSQIDIRRAARPLLHDALHMQVVDTYGHSAVFVVDIGSRVPVITTSIGRAYLCAVEESERRSILDQLRVKHPADWPVARRRMEEALRDYQQHGFCLSIGDWRRDVNAVAAPFDPRDGTKPVVVGCSGAAFQLGPDLLKTDIGPRLLALVGNLRSTLHPE